MGHLSRPDLGWIGQWGVDDAQDVSGHPQSSTAASDGTDGSEPAIARGSAVKQVSCALMRDPEVDLNLLDGDEGGPEYQRKQCPNQ